MGSKEGEVPVTSGQCYSEHAGNSNEMQALVLCQAMDLNPIIQVLNRFGSALRVHLFFIHTHGPGHTHAHRKRERERDCECRILMGCH